jgi:hypothetical protein
MMKFPPYPYNAPKCTYCKTFPVYLTSHLCTVCYQEDPSRYNQKTADELFEIRQKQYVDWLKQFPTECFGDWWRPMGVFDRDGNRLP